MRLWMPKSAVLHLAQGESACDFHVGLDGGNTTTSNNIITYNNVN